MDGGRNENIGENDKKLPLTTYSPIVSYGFICFKNGINLEGPVAKVNEDQCSKCYKVNICDTQSITKNPLVLMIQRRNSMGYNDLLRGKYDNYNQDVLYKYCEELTCVERKNILNVNFDFLWEDLWINHNNRCYLFDKQRCKFKFLKNKHIIDQKIKSLENHYKFTEFGFPKGRLDKFETTMECALRELSEETGYMSKDLDILEIDPVVEEFIGTNGIHYKHIYYLAVMKQNCGDPLYKKTDLRQICEVENIWWVDVDNVENVLRHYDYEKKNTFKKALELYKSLM